MFKLLQVSETDDNQLAVDLSKEVTVHRLGR